MNAGNPRSFPRINGYVLVPCDEGFVVGQVEWLTIEHSAYPKRKGLQDFGLIDLPFPLRKMRLNPVGTLISDNDNTNENILFKFRRGVNAFPSVGAPVFLPTDKQLHSIIESGKNRRIQIGTSPLARSAKVMVDPDRLFGRHLAVLGNTGSGKSCSVAGLIRWSLEAAKESIDNKRKPNARFIVLDPNGEYTRAFQDIHGARFYSADPGEKIDKLNVPLWFWNSAEWCAFTKASPGVQKPAIREALRRQRNLQNGSSGQKDTQSNFEINEDIPIRFKLQDFIADLDSTASNSINKQWFDSLLARVKLLLADTRMKSIVEGNNDIQLDSWLNKYIGSPLGEDGPLTVIDLSIVPSEIIHVITAVISRIIFEALQRYRKMNPKHSTLPTVLVIEEAHTFIKRYKDDVEDISTSVICCQIFERIAREGRKFGLGLVLSSQRPSELSPTVLSQCNTFLLHRISNDRDQDLVHKLVPDNLKGLLRDLPSLSSQNAILLGWATEIPTLVRINDLPKNNQPLSDDPTFWDIWTSPNNSKDQTGCNNTNWERVVKEWTEPKSQ